MVTVEGFRHRRTGCLYFSAAAQAAEAAEGDCSPGPSLGVDADCQAHYTRSDAVQTNAEADTQTPTPGAPPHGGRVITASAAAAGLSPAAAHAATLIQAKARGWLVRRHMAQQGSTATQEAGRLSADEQEAAAAAAEAQQRELQRQLHPKTAADFAFLRDKVRRWMAQETAAVKAANLNDDELQAKLLDLCRKEIKYLQTIDQRQAAVLKAARADRVSQQLQQTTAPEQWPMHNGKLISVVTPSVARAKEVAAVHAQLSSRLMADERQAVLQQARTLLRASGSHIEALELMDRESDLLNRGRSQKSLLQLQRRILQALQDSLKLQGGQQ